LRPAQARDACPQIEVTTRPWTVQTALTLGHVEVPPYVLNGLLTGEDGCFVPFPGLLVGDSGFGGACWKSPCLPCCWSHWRYSWRILAITRGSPRRNLPPGIGWSSSGITGLHLLRGGRKD